MSLDQIAGSGIRASGLFGKTSRYSSAPLLEKEAKSWKLSAHTIRYPGKRLWVSLDTSPIRDGVVNNDARGEYIDFPRGDLSATAYGLMGRSTEIPGSFPLMPELSETQLLSQSHHPLNMTLQKCLSDSSISDLVQPSTSYEVRTKQGDKCA